MFYKESIGHLSVDVGGVFLDLKSTTCYLVMEFLFKVLLQIVVFLTSGHVD